MEGAANAGFSGEDDEQWFDASQSDQELSNLLKSLDNDDDEEFDFENAADAEIHAEVDSMVAEMKTSKATDEYLESFEQTIRHDMLMIGSISAQQVDLHEKALKENKIKQQQLEALQKQKREQVLAVLVESAKKRLIEQMKEQNNSLSRREHMLKQQEKILQSDLQKAFNQAENELCRFLEQRKAEIRAFYGKLDRADNQYGGSKGRRWRVDWTETPQPIQINIKCARGVRDKLPHGQYVVMVSLYDQLGGHVLKWSKLYGQQWSGSTLPVHHDGLFTSSEIAVEQNVFTVLPSQWQINPGMVLVFEVFLLRGSLSPTDRVVSWGCFPVCNQNFEIIRGKYKLPLLRGYIDDRITKHSTIERLVATDIDHWIANLYIEVTRLPRYLSGQKEHEVELQFTSSMLSFPDRLRNTEEAVDGEKLPEYQSEIGSRPTSTGDEEKLSDNNTTTNTFIVTVSEDLEDKKSLKITKEEVVSQKLLNVVITDGSERSSSGVVVKKVPPPKLTHVEELSRHTVAIKSTTALSKLKRTSNQNAEFLGRMLIAEAGISQWKSPVFWIGVLIMTVLWFLRLYVHYCGQWLLLQAIGIPVSAFNLQPYTVDLNYQADLLTTGEEVGVIVIGPITNIVLQCFFVLTFWACQLIFGELPLIVSKIILLFCIWTVIDPLMILIVDSGMQRYLDDPTQPVGDAFKLYWHFYRIEGSGVVGIPLTIFLYGVVMFSALVVGYIYFLKLHNNGRIQDVFHRLHASEDDLFVPYDLEVSIQELDFIISKSEQWRGQDGERRKTSVYDYIWDEQNEGTDDVVREITRHISIHTLHLDGLRELYRHFLVLPDGAIVEIFDELKIPSAMSPDVETALMRKGGKLVGS